MSRMDTVHPLLTGVDHREAMRYTSVMQLFVGNYRVSSDLVQLLNAGFIEITFWAEHLLFISTDDTDYDTDVRLVYDEVEEL
jgi:hypothetical protein